MKENYLNLFSDCFLVKGAKRGILCDVNRAVYTEIEHNLIDLLAILDSVSMEQIYEKFDVSEHLIIKEFIKFLLEKEWCFITDDKDRFPPIELDWESPRLITNSIIDVGDGKFNYPKIVKAVSSLGAQVIQIRIYKGNGAKTVQLLEKMLFASENVGRVGSIEIMMPYLNYDFFLDDIAKIVNQYRSVVLIGIFKVLRRI